jgi:transcriptional regulator with XRE-family HTH domain
MLAQQGTLVRHVWLAEHSAVPLNERLIPEDVEIVIIDSGPSIRSQERERLAHIAKTELHLFVIKDPLSPRGVCQRLEEWGFIAAPIELEPHGEEHAHEEALSEPAVVEPAPAAPPTAATVDNEPKDEPMSATPYAIAPCKSWKEAGALLKRLREERPDPVTGRVPMRASYVAKRTGYSATHVGSVEKGKARPSDAMCDALEELFHLPANTLPRVAKSQVLSGRRAAKLRMAGANDVTPAQKPAPEPARTPAERTQTPEPLPTTVNGSLMDGPKLDYYALVMNADSRDVVSIVHALHERMRTGSDPLARIVITPGGMNLECETEGAE